MDEQHIEASPVTVFYSYAHADEKLRKQLEKHLSLLRQQGIIAEWHDRLIVPGTDWAHEINLHLSTASVILLLISPDFLASEYCYGIEMQRALARHQAGEARVIPIILRPVDWKHAPFAMLQCLPTEGKPVTTWRNRDEAFRDVAEGIRTAIEHFRTTSSLSQQLASFTEGPRASYKQPGLFMAADLPVDFVARPQEFEALKHSILHGQSDRPTAITTALHGAGGYGKTTLALALCHDVEIQAAFPDGILWVTLGEQSKSLIGQIEDLLYLLTHERPGFTSLEAAAARLREVLKDRRLLLVIDDVRRESALSPFLQGGPHCARLITTRINSLLPAAAYPVQVDAMREHEAVQLLQRGLEQQPGIEELELTFRRLSSRLGEWPLLLTLTNGVLRERVVRLQEPLLAALNYVQRLLDKKGVVAFDNRDAQEREKAVARTLGASLEQLEESELARYEELAIFSEDVVIPLATVQCLWQATGGLDELDTDSLCQRLSGLSLVLSYNLKTRRLRLHDVVHDYLQAKVRPRLPIVHAQFLDNYKLDRWAELPFDEPYLWDHLAEHLVGAGRAEELIALVKDLQYLAAKTFIRSANITEVDLNIAERLAPSDKLLRLMKRCFSSMGHLLNRGKTLFEIEATLHCRLYHLDQLSESCQALENDISRPFVTSWHPLPDLSNPALVRTLMGHTHKVNDCAVSPDGQWIVSASDDHTLKVWDAVTGEERLTLRGHEYRVYDCAVSPDGQWIVSASLDTTLKVWDIATGKERLTLRGHRDSVLGCAISPDGAWIVSASGDGTLKIWDAKVGTASLTLRGHRARVNDCAVSPDGQWIVSASEDMTLKVWKAATGKEHLTLYGHGWEVSGCAFSPDGERIISASWDGTVKVWNALTGEELLTLHEHRYSGFELSYVWGCAVSPDGRWIVSASEDGAPKVWDIITGEERCVLRGHTERATSCAISPDGQWIVSTSWDRTLKVWDVAACSSSVDRKGHKEPVTACAVSPDGQWVVSTSAELIMAVDDNIKVWDATTGEERFSWKGHKQPVNDCAISPDGQWFVTASDDGTLRVWSATTKRKKRLTLKGVSDDIECCSFSSDGQWIVSASGTNEPKLKIWSAVTGEERLTLRGHKWVISACAVSPDGRWLISGSWDGELKIWDIITGEEHLSWKGHDGHVNDCAISPDGQWIVSASGNRFTIDDSPSIEDNTLKVWDLATGKERLTLYGHTGAVVGCAISPDEQWIVSVSKDQTLKIWDAVTGEYLTGFYPDGPLTACAVFPDSEHIVAGGDLGVYFLTLVK